MEVLPAFHINMLLLVVRIPNMLNRELTPYIGLSRRTLYLIHSGHNHFVEEKPVPGIVAAHRSMIDKIMQVNPDAVILIAGVIHSGKLPKYSYIAELNESLRQMVEDVNRPNVKYVSVNDGFDWRIHTIADKVHPNLTGAFVMACNWFKVLNPIILQCFVEKKS